MIVTETITITKTGANFATLEEALTAFDTDNATADFATASSENLSYVDAGDCIQTFELLPEKNGFKIIREWAQETWTVIAGDSPSRPALASDWIRTASVT